MTSQSSSPRSDRRAFSPFLFSFSRALSENFIFPLLNALFLSAFVVVIPAAFTFSPTQNPDIARALESGKTARDVCRCVITVNEPVITYMILLGVCILAAATGVFLFRFMAAKKTVNVYYSLGIKRRSLFLAKYAAGAVLLAISVAAPMLVNAVINIHYLGSSPELWRAVAYHTLGLYILAMLCLTVTAAVFSAVGTVLEGAGFSAVILLLPTLLIYCLQQLMSMLWGNPYGQSRFLYAERLDVSESLVTTLSRFNPLLFLADGINNTAIIEADQKATDILWPSFASLLPWIAVIGACLALALLVFQRRRTEICGFLGRNRILNFAVELVLGFASATAVLCALYDRISHAAAAAIALLVYTAVYVVVELILTRAVRPAVRGAWKLPVHLALFLGVFAIFATGLFGYEDRIPDVSEIEKVYVNADYNFEIYSTEYGPDGRATDATGIVSVSENWKLAGALVTQRDKELATQLHRAMIAARDADSSQRLDRRTAIVYQLKDGSVIRRYYPYTTLEESRQSLALYESDWSREQLRKALSADPAAGDESDPAYVKFGYETGVVQIGNGVDFEPLTLTRAQHTALKEALIADVTAMTAQDFFRPAQVICFLKFSGTGEEAMYYDFTGVSGLFPVTEKMNRVRAWIKQNGLTGRIPQQQDAPDEIYIRSAAADHQIEYDYMDMAYSERHFYTVRTDPAPQEVFDSSAAYNGLHPLTAAQLDAVREHLLPWSYTDNGGYFITFNYPSYTCSYYLPAQYATPEIRALAGR